MEFHLCILENMQWKLANWFLSHFVSKIMPIFQVTSSDIVTSDELCAFGKNLNKVEVPENVRKPILRAIWKCISRLTSLKGYMACCDVWVEFAAKYFTVNELHIILEAIIQKLSPEKVSFGNIQYLFTKCSFRNSKPIMTILFQSFKKLLTPLLLSLKF